MSLRRRRIRFLSPHMADLPARGFTGRLEVGSLFTASSC